MSFFALSEISAKTSVKVVAIDVLVIGDVLCIEGGLAIRSKLDRTFKHRRGGSVAVELGVAEILADVVAKVLASLGAAP